MGVSASPSSDQFYPWWYLVPLYPYGYKPTLRFEVVPDWIWTFEQYQGIFYVVVPVRMTVIRLAMGGLWVYAPIAPTAECVRLVRELEAKYGKVRYIILPTISGLEHKAFIGPFARQFPTAQLYIAPGQWSFPLNLPLRWLGFPTQRTQVLPADPAQTPFADEFDYAMLGPLDLKLGWFGEVAFCHRRSQTLLVTDTLISLPATPPAIVQLEPYPLLFHAKDSPQDPLRDTPENRVKGWQRICLFALYFRASSLQVAPLLDALKDCQKASDRSRKAFWGFYPFQWTTEWPRSFEQLRGNGRLLVAPILQQLLLNRYPQTVLDWVEKMSQWPLQQVIPAHFAAPCSVNTQELRQAFAFSEKQLSLEKQFLIQESFPLPSEDFTLLKELDQQLVRFRITPPPYHR